MIKSEHKNKIFTIPNLLTTIRILLIPVFIWLYSFKNQYFWAGGILLLSGFTDMLDGFIARKFNLISDLGKMLDPLADKLTQAAILFCLLARFPLMLLPLIFLFVKELLTFILGVMVVRKTGKIKGADWHGKLTTIILYLMMGLHVIWYGIPEAASNVLIIIAVIIMANSFILYAIQHLTVLLSKNSKKEISDEETEN